MIRLQRIIQSVSFVFFVILLFYASHPFRVAIPVDLYLSLDPLTGIMSSIADRSWITPALVPSFVLIALTVIFGRFFCGHVCPLGAMIDCSEVLRNPKPSKDRKANSIEQTSGYRRYKYIFLSFIAVAALSGVSIVFLGSPISIATRVLGLAFYPLSLLMAETGLDFLTHFQAFASQFNYMQLQTRVFSTNEFIVLFFLVITSLSLVQPRFWCRNLCPAGAMLALFSVKPPFRRRVNDSCIHCNQCLRECPSGCITQEHISNVSSECLVCLKCSRTCPVSAISFGFPAKSPVSRDDTSVNNLFPTRRQTLAGIFSGLTIGAVIRTGWNQPKLTGQEKTLSDSELIRPPGSIPEKDFLARCVRCGLCMKACPTNTLQPIWFKAGLEGIFSPILVPRLAACELNCAVCGQVCPTSAIRPLDLPEKKSVKIGTAWIDRQICLVWNQDKKCLVCDEVCPYNAVIFAPTKDRKNAVPHVIPNKCTGCGWCENKCPVTGTSAIRISILGEVRLGSGSYIEKAAEYGLEFKTDKTHGDVLAPDTFDVTGKDLNPDAASEAKTPSRQKDLPEGFTDD